MNLRQQHLPIYRLMELEKQVNAILSEYPEASSAARMGFFAILQKLYDVIREYEVESILQVNDKIDDVFANVDKIYLDLIKYTSELDKHIKSQKQKERIIFAKNLAVKKFDLYPTGVGLDVNLDKQLITHIDSLVTHYVDAKFPALILGGEYCESINKMVGGDPLYLCVNQTKLDKFKEIINNDFYFNSRLRKYPYDVFDIEILNNLPPGQFNLILAQGHMDMIPAFYLQNYVNKIKALLRDGGVFIFSFFDTAIPYSTQVMEAHLSEVNTKHFAAMKTDPAWWRKMELFPICYELSDYLKIINLAGLKFLNYSQFINHSVVVCQKYGELSTVKRRQNLGEIKSIQQ